MRIPKLCRNPDGRAFVTIPGTRGKIREYFGKHGSPEAESAYREWLTRFLDAQESAAIAVTKKHRPSVAVVVANYLDFAERYYAGTPGSKKSETEFVNVKAASATLLEMFGTTPADDFGPLKLLAIQDHLAKLKYRRSVVNGRVGRIKRLFRWAVSRELVEASISHALDAVAGLRRGRSAAAESRKVKPAPLENVAALLPFLSPTLAAMVQVQLYCGMRPSEVCIMRPRDVDRSGSIWLYSPKSHKNEWRDQECIKAIPLIAQPILNPFLSRVDDRWCFDSGESADWHLRNRKRPSRKTPVYPCEVRRRLRAPAELQPPSRFDRRSYYRSIRYAFQRAKKKGVSIPCWHPHQLRHSIATQIDKSLGRQAAQRWLGHSKMDTTGIYVEHQVEELVTLAYQVDQMLSSALQPAQ